MSFGELVAGIDRAAMGLLGGESVIYRPTVEAEVEVVGVFDERYVLAKGDAEAGVETIGPAVFLRLEDLPVEPEDDEPIVEIRGVEYRVIERQPDGMGGVVLVLRLKT